MRSVRLFSQLAIGALVNDDLIAGNLIAVGDTEYRMRSIKLRWTWSNVANLDGGLLFGVAAPGLTEAQIEEFLEATSSIDKLDIVANERANRKVRVIGAFGSDPGNTSAADENAFNGGRAVSTKLNWLVPIGGTVTMWGYNFSTGNFVTGSELVAIGEAFIEYQ